MITSIIEFLVGGFLGLLKSIFSLLPNNPFSDVVSVFQDFISVNEYVQLGLSWPNWFIPIADVASIIGMWALAMVLFNVFLWWYPILQSFIKK